MNEKEQRNYDLQERLIEFAVRVLNVVESLPNSRVGNHVAGQLIRSGTSPAPNYGEAQSAESRKDFIHKMKVALKELRETLVWLLTSFLIHHSLLDIRYSILTARDCIASVVNHLTGAGVGRYASGRDTPIEACKLGPHWGKS